MEILTEIIEVSEGIIDTLESHKFFEDNVFIKKDRLKIKLQERMQRKWEQEGEILLSDNEFVDTCNLLVQEAVSDTLETLIDKGAVNMSIGNDGEILYSANKNFDVKDL